MSKYEEEQLSEEVIEKLVHEADFRRDCIKEGFMPKKDNKGIFGIGYTGYVDKKPSWQK